MPLIHFNHLQPKFRQFHCMFFFSRYINKKYTYATVLNSTLLLATVSLYVSHPCMSLMQQYIYLHICIYTQPKNSYTYKFVSSCSQCFTHIMEAPLTENAISSLLSGAVHLQPLLQVFSLQPFGPANATTPRFRITISDGSNTHQTLLPTTFNSLISNGELQEGSVIKLAKCTCTVVHNNTYFLAHCFKPNLRQLSFYIFYVLPTTSILY